MRSGLMLGETLLEIKFMRSRTLEETLLDHSLRVPTLVHAYLAYAEYNILNDWFPFF